MQGVASNYVTMAAAIVYSLISVPLALNFIGKEQFGLWALLTQIASYMWLIDLGMSPSVGRLLIEHKDRPDGGAYGSLMQTGFLVTAVQGALALVAGLALASPLSYLLRIPPDLHVTFCALVRWQSVITAAMFGTRMFRNVLYAHQRNDLVNYIQAASSLMGIVTLWLMLHWHGGVLSILWSNASALLFAVLVGWWTCMRLRLLPPSGAWSRPSWQKFKEMFGYGKDVFVVQAGSFLIGATQSIIVSRSLGLEAVAAWSVGTKVFFLLSSLIYQAFDLSTPALSEMMVRGEHERLRKRFTEMVVVSQILSGVAAIIYAVCNSAFVSVWTHDRITWSAWNDVLLGGWMVVSVLIHANSGFVVLTKRLAGLRYIYLLEGVVFVIGASLVTPSGGLPAMIGISLLCGLCFSGAYGIWRINKYFQFRLLDLQRLWLSKLGRICAFLVPAAIVICWVTTSLSNLNRLILNAAVVGGLGGYLFFRSGIPPDLRAEILHHVPQPLRRFLEKLVAGPTAATKKPDAEVDSPRPFR
jgi:O-antigen/teichoic acid export membrane protein